MEQEREMEGPIWNTQGVESYPLGGVRMMPGPDPKRNEQVR